MSTTDVKEGSRRGVPMDRTLIDHQPAGGEEPTSVDQIKLEAGLRIEQYELIRELGRGGMGQVFLARDTKLGRRVAIKFLAARSKRFTERFLVEAKVTARVSHENIVAIYGVDEFLGLPYMVLEYVEGTTIGTLIENKRLPLARSVELIVPVVRALARAHESNIIHRDLKPDNIIVTAAGTVKVLDFGVAKLFTSSRETPPSGVPRARPPTPSNPADLTNTKAGSIVGTLPYMSPEQLGTEDVDHRSDLWAVGIILYEMLAGKHPLEPVTQGRLFGAAAALDEPMPSLGSDMPGLPDRMVQIVARCLAKRKADRYATAADLLADLEPLLPSRSGRSLAGDESPYPGLTAFQESDANRFFGRKPDIAAAVAKLRDTPLVGVVGPSGVGKSSFVRAGVVPALKSSGEAWEVLIVRPGRYPLSALASTVEQLRDSRDSDPLLGDDVTFLLRNEPGTFGARLRARARKRRTQIIVFVDQHEELYTLVPDAGERLAFTACLAGASDDPSGPVRVVVAIRSDFLDRAAEDRRFVEELARGLVFLQPPNRAGLEAALTQPLEMVGYSFESGVVHAMLETLEATQGALPLLQFTAAKLWDARDKQRRVLTRETYLAMGGVAGALATHADEVLAAFSQPDQRTVRAIFQRLVTPERTRAIVDQDELRELAPAAGVNPAASISGPDVDRVIHRLVGARLLVVQTRGEGAGAVELVHESLIKSWPTLQRWLDENQEDAAYLAQLRAASKQWDTKGRPEGLLWRGEAMEEARLWRSRYQGDLPQRESDFLNAVLELATRATRRRRRAVVAAFVFLCALVAAAGAALIVIRQNAAAARRAEQTARDEAAAAHSAKQKAEQAEAQLKIKVDELTAAQDARDAADAAAKLADADRVRTHKEKEVVVQKLATTAKTAEQAKRQAKDATKLAAEDARKKREAEEKAKRDAQRKKIETGDLK
ncbi:MAG TPA: protein kinase [Kofleriaceae bacterium]